MAKPITFVEDLTFNFKWDIDSYRAAVGHLLFTWMWKNRDQFEHPLIKNFQEFKKVSLASNGRLYEEGEMYDYTDRLVVKIPSKTCVALFRYVDWKKAVKNADAVGAVFNFFKGHSKNYYSVSDDEPDLMNTDINYGDFIKVGQNFFLEQHANAMKDVKVVCSNQRKLAETDAVELLEAAGYQVIPPAPVETAIPQPFKPAASPPKVKKTKSTPKREAEAEEKRKAEIKAHREAFFPDTKPKATKKAKVQTPQAVLAFP